MAIKTSKESMRIVESGRRIMAFIEAEQEGLSDIKQGIVLFYAARREAEKEIQEYLREGQLLFAKESGFL